MAFVYEEEGSLRSKIINKIECVKFTSQQRNTKAKEKDCIFLPNILKKFDTLMQLRMWSN